VQEVSVILETEAMVLDICETKLVSPVSPENSPEVYERPDIIRAKLITANTKRTREGRFFFCKIFLLDGST